MSGWLGSLDLQDRRLAGDDREKPLENAWRLVNVGRFREADVGRCAVGEHEGRRAEHAVLASRIKVIAAQRVKVRGIGEIFAEPREVKPGVDRNSLDNHHVVDVQPVAMPRLEQRHMELIEGILPPGGFRRSEGQPTAHVLRLWRVPGCPRVILGVHLGQREVPPGDLTPEGR